MAATVSHTAYVTNANIFCGCFAAFASDIHSIRTPRRFISGNDCHFVFQGKKRPNVREDRFLRHIVFKSLLPCHFALTNAAFFAMMKADQNKGESV